MTIKKGQRISPKTEFKKGMHYSPETEFKKGENLGDKHPFWKGGRTRLKIGYIWMYSPNHPRAYRNGVYEHILVAEKKLGRYLLPGETCHHVNGIKDDNRPENIIVFKSNRQHIMFHKLNKWSRKFDKCNRCGTTERKHEAFGLCENCYKHKKYHNL